LWLLVVACGCGGKWLLVAACGCLWLQVAASGCKWLQVVASGYVAACPSSCFLSKFQNLKEKGMVLHLSLNFFSDLNARDAKCQGMMA